MTNEKTNPSVGSGIAYALSAFPAPTREKIEKAIALSRAPERSITDIRLRRDGLSAVSSGGRSYKLDLCFTQCSFDEMIFALTSGSLYAHADTIREGYISVNGVRFGVCGTAVNKNGAIGEVADISSVSVRIARDVPGCSRRVFELAENGGSLCGVLVYSPPGAGKTTLLRDLIRTMSSRGRQIAVIDTRRELGTASFGENADLLSGYPKDEGIRCAVRSLSPEVIICDELSGERDAEAALYAHACGVPIVATAHAGTVRELYLRREMRALADGGVFRHIVGLRRRGDDVRLIVEEP